MTTTEKACTNCDQVKPLAEYRRRAASRDGHDTRCKTCVAAYYEAYYEANKERKAARDKAYREANRDEVAARKKAYREANKERIAARDRAYYEANREADLARSKAYREANREQIAARKQIWHAERWTNDPEYRARCKSAQIRRQRLLADAKQEPYTREEIFERDGWICGICDEPIDPTIRYEDDPRACATIDHVIPLSRGGDDTPANVQAAHGSCNYGKCDRVEHEDEEVAA